MDDFNKIKAITKIPPYVGYEFETEPLGEQGIICSKHDYPKFAFNINKMRQNIHCLQNPNVFNDARKGKFAFGRQNTHVVRNYHNMRTIKNPTHVVEDKDFMTAKFVDLNVSNKNASQDIIKGNADNLFDAYREVTASENRSIQRSASTTNPNFFKKYVPTSFILPKRKKVANSLYGALVPVGYRSYDKFAPLKTEASDLDIKVQNLRRKRTSFDSNNVHHSQFNKICAEADPVYVRENCEYKDGKLSKFNNNWTNFNDRVDKNYVPNKKPLNDTKWDIKKQEMLQFIKKNKNQITQSQDLIKCVNKTNEKVDLEYKWPTHTKTKAFPVKFVHNDEHIKCTNAGYSRCYDNGGKPFFS